MSTNIELTAEQLTEFLANDNIEQAFEIIKELPPVDIADLIEVINPEIAWGFLTKLPSRGEVFANFEAENQVAFALAIPRKSFAKIFSEMAADDRADLFKLLEQEKKDELLPALAHAEREDIRKLAAYQEGTAGAIMTSEYAMLRADMLASEALDALRKEAPDAETIYQAYVIDQDRLLLGVVSLRDLILAHPARKIESLMTKGIVTGVTDENQEEIAKKITRYDLIALPITNDAGKLVGIVTYDDAMDVFSQETTDDFHKSAAVATDLGNLKDATINLLYRKRVFWLVLLAIGNLLSGAGIAHFEDIIAANIALVFFLPLLVASGGNAGAQSATLMVRALATGEVVMRDWFKLVGREFLLALALGATMALLVSGMGFWRGGDTGAELSTILALSMTSVVIVGCVIGMSLPFILSRVNLDPASASAPLITTICDISGVIIYLYIASIFLDGLIS